MAEMLSEICQKMEAVLNTVNLQEVLIVNGIGIVLMVFLLLMRFENIQKKSNREWLYDAMIWLTITGCSVEAVTFLIDGRIFKGCVPLAYFLNSICFISTCCVGFLWCLYVDLRIFNSLHRIRKSMKYLIIPLLIDVMMCLVNLNGCGILFTISEDNIYRRGRFSIITYIILFFYFIYSICLVDRSKKRGLYVQRFPTSYFVIPCMIGTIVQGMMYGITLGWTAVALAFLFVYIQLQSLNSLVDPLSGLYNRRYLDNILEHLQRNPKRSVYGVMMDVNNFKKINDNFGHSQGDDAIRNIGKILSDSIPNCGIAIRYAGDEFILLLSTDSMDVVNDTMDQIQHNIDRFNESKKGGYQLSLAMGYEYFDPKSGDTQAFLLAMDKRMYDAKEKYYSQHAK